MSRANLEVAFLAIASVSATTTGCNERPERAPASASVEGAVSLPPRDELAARPTTAPAAQASTVSRYVLDPSGKTTVDMPAPKERIRADTTVTRGELTLDPHDLAKTRGQVGVDLTTLTTHTFDDAKRNQAQTEHAHNWLEAGDLVSREVKEGNRWATFTLRDVEAAPLADLSQVPVTARGADDTRTVTLTVTGDLFIHGKGAPKTLPVEVTLHYPSGQAGSAAIRRIDIRTQTPLHVVLAEHDVKPRDAVGKLAQASFSLLGTKVGETADVTFDLSATLVSAVDAAP